MKLSDELLESLPELEKKGCAVPRFDVKKMRETTFNSPAWVHFGAGNIFRAFIADACQNLLDNGDTATGIIVAEGFDYDIIKSAYRAFDNLSLIATLNCDGKFEKKLNAAVSESLCADRANSEDWNRLEEIFRSPSLQMVSFTITEKGYALSNCENPDSMMSKLTSLLKIRFKSPADGKLPLAVVSMDNCSGNGEKLKAAVLRCAEKLGDDSFIAYLSDENTITFPCSMIDKITPRPDARVMKAFEDDGFENMGIIITDKHTYTAPFVNTERPQYLVVEDKFPCGRPPLEKAGIIFTDRATVDKAEKMKVCTCLNPLHTSLAIFGCLLGYTSISAEMSDSELSELVKRIGYDEGLPVVVNPKIIDPKAFIDEVVNSRLPNKFIPDTPQRISCDTSQKIPIRYGETIKAYLNSDILDVKSLVFIPLTLAGWCRYLMAVDDFGKPFSPADDPELPRLTALLKKASLTEKNNVHELLFPVLSDAKLFGVDLYAAGIGEKTEQLFAELTDGVGAVRKTLCKYLA